MDPKPTTRRGRFIACLSAHEATKRLTGLDIAKWIANHFRSETKAKAEATGKDKEGVIRQIAAEIREAFPKWVKEYPNAKREKAYKGKQEEWLYYRSAELTLHPEDAGRPAARATMSSRPKTKRSARSAPKAKSKGGRETRKNFFLARRAIKVMGDEPGTRFSSRDLAERIVEIVEKTTPEDKKLVRDQDGTAISEENLVSNLAGRMLAALTPHIEKRTIRSEMEGGSLKFYFPGKEDQDTEADTAEGAPPPPPRGESKREEQARYEKELYTPLAYFLYLMHSVHCCIVSAGGPAGEGATGVWTHPDVVGMEPLSANGRWEPEVRAAAKSEGRGLFRLWSFEVKKETPTPASARMAFFQAVANSSWANYSYLVTTRVGDKARNELRVLSNLHGIGVISLNIDEVEKSRILLPARERPNIDWDAANRLAGSNQKVKACLKLASEFEDSESVLNSPLWVKPSKEDSA